MTRRLVQAPGAALWVLAGLVLACASAWLLAYSRTWTPTRGLTAAVYRAGDATPQWTGPDVTLTPAHLATRAHLDPADPFEVEWQGLLVAQEAGRHRIRTRVDDGVAVWIADRLVLDERTELGLRERTAAVDLSRGLHPIRIRYVQRGGESLLRLSWQRPPVREEFRPVPVVAASDPPPVFRRLDKALAYPRWVGVGWAVWLLAGLGLAAWALVELAAGATVVATLGRAHAVVALTVIVPLLGATLDLGVLPWRGWAPDEIRPDAVADAANLTFGRGWFHLYPPLMFYVYAVVHAPFVLLEGFGWLALSEPAVFAWLHTLDRATTCVLAVVTCLGVGLLTARVAGPAAGRWAPYALAGVALVAFYSKTTNVDMPYTFWVVVAMLAFTSARESRRIRDHVVLGLAAAAAVATKDQAYGYFAGPALALLWRAWQAHAALPWRGRIARLVGDSPLWCGLTTAALVYVVLAGLLWNADGVRAHLALITGQASTAFRLFPATAAGTIDLLGTTVVLFAQAVGPVVTVLALGGVVVAASRATGAAALWLLVFPASYVLTFVTVVGYVYDRFLLAAVPCAIVFAAIALDAVVPRVGPVAGRRVLVMALAAALLLPAALLDHRLATDSRFDAERWMQTHLSDDPLVLGVGTYAYLPNLHPYQQRMVVRARASDLLSWQPDVIVFNDDFLARPGQTRGTNVPEELTRAGYVEAFTTGRRQPPPGVLGMLASGLAIDPLLSNLSKISPPVSIWRTSPRSVVP